MKRVGAPRLGTRSAVEATIGDVSMHPHRRSPEVCFDHSRTNPASSLTTADIRVDVDNERVPIERPQIWPDCIE